MGSRIVRFNFTPRENEQIEAVIKIPEEPRSIIHGTVKDDKNKVVKDAVVKLFELLNPHDPYSIKPLSYAFTDDYGQFLFGPLTPCKNYLIKIWVNNVKIRELVIHPDNSQNICQSKEEDPDFGSDEL